jgi:membrane dipeptidase
MPIGLSNLGASGAVLAVEASCFRKRQQPGMPHVVQIELLLEELARARNSMPKWFVPDGQRFSLALEGTPEMAFEEYLDYLPAISSARVRLIQPYHQVCPGFMADTSRFCSSGRAERLLKRVVDEGMIVDLSHMPEALLRYCAERIEGPVLVSHGVLEEYLEWSVVRRPNAHPAQVLRDLRPALVGIPFVDDIVSWRATPKSAERDTSILLVARHILAMADVVGVEHVALGPDYFDYDCWPDPEAEIGCVKGLETADGLLQLAKELLRLGFAEADVKRVFCANAERVLIKGDAS